MDDCWLKCSACRRDVAFGALHWVCSVTTCNRQRTRLVFCSVACWDSHVAMLRHREAWAVEARAPSAEAWAREQAVAEEPPRPRFTTQPITIPPLGPAAAAPPAAEPRRRVVAEASPRPAPAAGPALAEAEHEVLIVVSRLKKYIKDRAGMNCSDAVADELSAHVRALCDDAIRAAAADERKTVLDRDVPRARRP